MKDDMDKASSTNQTTTPCWDCLSNSGGSETSAAVVSLYQTWTGSTLSLCDTKSTQSSSTSPRGFDQHLATDRLGSYTITTSTNGINPVEPSSSWSVSCDPANGMFEGDDDITLWGLDDTLPPSHGDISRLRHNLSKRLRSEDDIPEVPVLKKRRRPVCHFLNFMGTRREELPCPPPFGASFDVAVADDNPWHLVGLGLEETDALFPMSLAEPGTTSSTAAIAPVAVVTTKNVFTANSDDDDAKMPCSTYSA